jgi:NAD(P)-dependent dehydrogenase (short-subunit alcohol dehydrogenase family)
VATTVLITGCSSGIGRATAEHLAGQGFDVYATARRVDSLADLEAKGCRTLALDVTDDASARAAVERVESEAGGIDVLVNNAGYGRSGAVESIPIDDIRSQFETNVLGYLRMAHLVLPGMRERGAGRILNISSVAGKVTMPGSGVYSASKFAIEAISDALRYEVGGFGIRVVVIQPGPIRTQFTSGANETIADAAAAGPYADFHAAVAKADAEGDQSRLAGDAEDVAKAIERAIRARRPKPRYTVTPLARIAPWIHAVLSDRAWDGFLRGQVKPPAP